jgi:hypothetical protein
MYSQYKVTQSCIVLICFKDNPPVAAFTGHKSDNNNGGASYEIVSMSTIPKEKVSCCTAIFVYYPFFF